MELMPPTLTKKQVKLTSKVQTAVGPQWPVYLGTQVRQSFAMTPVAWVMVAGFALMAFKLIVPGVILILVFRDLVKVPKFLALTPAGVAVVDRSMMNGKPTYVMQTFAPGEVFVASDKQRVKCGETTYELSKKDAVAFRTITSKMATMAQAQPVFAPSVAG